MNDPLPPEMTLTQLSSLATQQVSLEREIEEAEKKLSSLKEKHKQISENLIPDTLLGCGLTELKLADGTKITVTPYYSAKIPDEKTEQAYQWLDEHGHSGIVKCEVGAAFSRGEYQEAKRVLEKLQEAGYEQFSMTQSVHHSTLKAFVKEQIESGEPIPRDLFGVYVGNKTKVK
jgi:hypothetical protein